MYKLLLVGNEPEVVNAFQAVTSWEQLGFRAPRIVETADEAIESLKKHHADGIAMCLSGDERIKLGSYLTQTYPLLPIMHAGCTTDEVLRDVGELAKFLTNIYADTTDERYDLAEHMQRMRHAYFRKLISGKINSRDAVRRRLSILRSRMDPDAACVLLRFALPGDDGYLSGHWHYGPDRLQIAMRNFFGAELEGMRLLVSVLQDDRIYLLACPMRGSERMDGESLTGLVEEHANACINHVREYLDIDLRIDEIYVLPTVLSLADCDVMPKRNNDHNEEAGYGSL